MTDTIKGPTISLTDSYFQLDLPTRPSNAIVCDLCGWRSGLRVIDSLTVADVVSYSAGELLGIRGLGVKSVKDVIRVLADAGWELGDLSHPETQEAKRRRREFHLGDWSRGLWCLAYHGRPDEADAAEAAFLQRYLSRRSDG